MNMKIDFDQDRQSIYNKAHKINCVLCLFMEQPVGQNTKMKLKIKKIRLTSCFLSQNQ